VVYKDSVARQTKVITAISDSTWKSLKIMKPLEETGISLYGPDNTNLKILGKINLTLTQAVLVT